MYGFGSTVRFWRLKPHFAPPFALDHREADDDVTTLAVPGYRQARAYSCGYASVLMVVRHFDPAVRALDLYERLGTGRSGTSQTAIIRELRSAGLSVGVRYDMDFALLEKSIDQGKPVIAYLNDAEHWLVLYGYGRSPERVFVADPRPAHACEQTWQDYGPRLGGFGIVCSRRASLPEDAEPEPENANSQLSFVFSSDAASRGG